jgi:hypothetical protein
LFHFKELNYSAIFNGQLIRAISLKVIFSFEKKDLVSRQQLNNGLIHSVYVIKAINDDVLLGNVKIHLLKRTVTESFNFWIFLVQPFQ